MNSGAWLVLRCWARGAASAHGLRSGASSRGDAAAAVAFAAVPSTKANRVAAAASTGAAAEMGNSNAFAGGRGTRAWARGMATDAAPSVLDWDNAVYEAEEVRAAL
jgi:hypothetical protein